MFGKSLWPCWLFLALALARHDGWAFVHPGLTNNQAELDFIKQQVKAGAQPWKSAYAKLASDSHASLGYKPSPIASVECGRYSSPNHGCNEERDDAEAAYTQALLWAVGGDAAHAQKAIEIMNAWPPVLKSHSLANATLQTGWAASNWMRAAEIIRHTGAGWADADVARFSGMLRNVYVHDLLQTQPGVDGLISIFGNWDLTILEGLTGIAVFLDDDTLFHQTLDRFRKRLPAYLYLASDGALPVAPPDAPNATSAQLVQYWFGQSTFKDGLSEETCRDMIHYQYGLSAAAVIAEIAYKQGEDVYAEQKQRMVATMEFNAPFAAGAAVPNWLCGGRLNRPTPSPTWEIAYNHYHNRLGMDLPNTKNLIAKIRPTGIEYHMAWETLTHAELGSQGAPTAARREGANPRGAQGDRKLVLLFDAGGPAALAVSGSGEDGKLRYWNIDGRLR